MRQPASAGAICPESYRKSNASGRGWSRCGDEFLPDDLTTMIVGAERRGARALRAQPRAHAVRYDRKTGRVLVEMTNGAASRFRRAGHRVWSGQATLSWRRSRSSGSDSDCAGRSSMLISACRACSPGCSAP